MPTVFGHALVATALGQWFPRRVGMSSRGSRIPNPARFWVWTAASAMLPDIDVIGFSFGIRYDEMLGHRGLTHSIPFALVVGFIAARLYLRSDTLEVGNWRLGTLWAYFSAIAASHGILDALTNGGRGIAFFAPFSDRRFFFPWRPIQVSPIGVGFFSLRGLDVLQSELLWILLPSAIIALLARMTGRRA